MGKPQMFRLNWKPIGASRLACFGHKTNGELGQVAATPTSRSFYGGELEKGRQVDDKVI